MTEAERRWWNLTLAHGNDDEIESAKTILLTRIFTRIMNDTPQYQLAGWTIN